MLPQWTVVGFTGHRTLADPIGTAARVGAVLDALAGSQGPLVAMTSLAKGADAIFAAEAVRRRIPLLIVLPFPVARFRQDFQPDEWDAVAPLLTHAAHVETLPEAETDEEAYMETGVRIVDEADVLVAVWDGRATAGLGGTGDVVAYARAMAKPIEWINPETGQRVSERMDQMPPAGVPVTIERGDPYGALDQHFRELDDAASLRAPNVRHLIQRIVLLHLVASLFALIALSFDIRGFPADLVALFEVAVLGTALALTALRRHRHTAWMMSRIEAEVCRSFLATWPMRSRISRPPRVTIQGFERLTRNLRLFQLTDSRPTPSLESARDAYLRGRVEDQIGYFSRRSAASQRAYTQLRTVAMVSTALAAGCAVMHLALSLAHVEGPVLTGTVSLSLVLPLISAAIFSLVLTHEHARRAARYREMVGVLERARVELRAVRTWSSLTRVALETEDALLTEAVEWHAFRRFASDPH
jgi:hypothetical protein